MDMRSSYRGLRFERRSLTIAGKLIPVGLALIIFTLLWVLVPHSTLYWLLLPVSIVLVWMAGHGWRQALASLHNLLHRLEQE